MKTFWKKIRNQLGMSLAEVMVAAGLAGGLALVIAQLGKNSGEVSKRAETKTTAQMLTGQINSILTDSQACGFTFGNNLDTPAELSDPNLLNSTGVALANGGIRKKDNNIFLTPTGSYSEITITGMVLKNVDITNSTGNLFITGTYKLSGKVVSMKPIKIPLNIILNGATWNASSKCFAAAGNYDSIWTSTGAGDGIYYSSGKVGIGTSAPDATLDIDRNIGVNLFSYWYSTVAPYKGIELQQDNYLVWEATTGTTTNSWGLGSVSTGLQINVKSTSGRPAGVRTIMDFNNDGAIYVYPRTGSSSLSRYFYVDAPVVSRINCQAQPAGICNDTFTAGVYAKGYNALGAGLGINAEAVNDGSGTNTTALFGFNAVGNGGSLILGDNNSAATVHMYSVPSTSTTATQTIDLTNYERFRFDANSNIILGRVAGGASTVSATGSPSFVIGGSLATTDITGGRGMVYSASAEATVSGSVGYGNRTYSRGSMAFGLGNIAGDSTAINVVAGNGITAFAAGAYNTASGSASVAVGQSSTASGQDAVAIGVASSAIKTDASAVGRGNQANGYGSSAFGYSNTAANTTDAFGYGASAFGYTNIASANYSVAMGFTNTASGSGSVAIGRSVTASAADVIALGTTFTASGANSVSLVGIGTTGGRAPAPTYGSTTATYATNLGVSNTVSAPSATAVGYRNTVNSISGGGAFGFMNTASGQDAYVFGRTSTASGSESLAIGGGVLASGSQSMALGYGTQATAANAISMGQTAYANHASAMIINGQNLGNTFYSSAANRFSAVFPGGFDMCTSLGMGQVCTGGVGVKLDTGASAWASLSDRNAKKNIVELDEQDELYVLKKLKDLPISTWIYKVSMDGSPNNIGPMAQDFNEVFAKVFKLFSNDKQISENDVAGINLVATKALIKENEALKLRVKQLEEQSKLFEMRLRIIEQKLK